MLLTLMQSYLEKLNEKTNELHSELCKEAELLANVAPDSSAALKEFADAIDAAHHDFIERVQNAV